MLTFPALSSESGKHCGHRIERDGLLVGMVVLRPNDEVVFILCYGSGEVFARTTAQVDAEVKTAFAELERR